MPQDSPHSIFSRNQYKSDTKLHKLLLSKSNTRCTNTCMQTDRENVRTHRFPLAPFTRYKEFMRMARDRRGSPCINVGTPYKSQLEFANEDYRRSKKKWLTKSGFLACGGKKLYKVIENYVVKDPSEPPVLHRFRRTSKGKWIAGSFKLS
eukprot:TRINITY_DN8633_c0_g1_i3.p2 TRINITY_DN8633_c0_g1~~TRINITY_DN8633_c0_g1_i3.p2  ORF type:complete len:150 (+),score=26.44 TRINITY_DN8633_c0_g1_i3:1384-1833(+)